MNKLLEAMCFGTLQLNTRSKFNQTPRLLVAVIMKENKPQIVALDLTLSLEENSNPKSISEVKLNITELIETLKENKNNIYVSLSRLSLI